MLSLKKRIGKAISARRKEVGFKTQVELGEAVGVDQTFVSKWETGAYKPSEIYIEKLKEVLKVGDDFFTTPPIDSEDMGYTTQGISDLVKAETSEQVSKMKNTHDKLLEKLVNRIDELEEKLNKEIIPGISASSLLSQIENTTPVHRKVVLSILLRDPALVRDESKELSQAVQALIKAP